MSRLLDPEALLTALATVPTWTRTADGKSIQRTFVFPDFSHAFAFMTRVALAAEKADHHPDWTNVYNRVAVTLSSHDANGLTAKDIALARVMDAVYAEG